MRIEEKMNHGGGVYTVIFSTELPTENRIIFFWAVALNSIGNFSRYLIDFRTKISKIPPDFLTSVSKPVGNSLSKHGRIGFDASIEKSVGNYADRPGSLTVVRFGICVICR